jgi:SAM-dependent methyltransferase
MISTASRAYELEMMDGADFGADEYVATLQQLELINRLTNGYGPTIAAVARAARKQGPALTENGGSPARPLRVLDVGFGYGDTLRALREWSLKAGVALELSGIELNPEATRLAKAATPAGMKIDFFTGDFFELAPDAGYDLVINSLFMHHLDDAQLVRTLGWMTRSCRVGWFVNDLHRHAIPYHFIRLVTRALRTSRLIRNDAPLSVARAFVRSDWLGYLAAAGVPRESVDIRWHWPFRFGVSYDRPLDDLARETVHDER